MVCLTGLVLSTRKKSLRQQIGQLSTSLQLSSLSTSTNAFAIDEDSGHLQERNKTKPAKLHQSYKRQVENMLAQI